LCEEIRWPRKDNHEHESNKITAHSGGPENHSAEEIAELRALLSVGADMRPDPRRPGFFEVSGSIVSITSQVSNGSKILLLGVWTATRWPRWWP